MLETPSAQLSRGGLVTEEDGTAGQGRCSRLVRAQTQQVWGASLAFDVSICHLPFPQTSLGSGCPGGQELPCASPAASWLLAQSLAVNFAGTGNWGSNTSSPRGPQR